MKITIKAEPKEIAALVLELRERPKESNFTDISQIIRDELKTEQANLRLPNLSEEFRQVAGLSRQTGEETP